MGFLFIDFATFLNGFVALRFLSYGNSVTYSNFSDCSSAYDMSALEVGSFLSNSPKRPSLLLYAEFRVEGM